MQIPAKLTPILLLLGAATAAPAAPTVTPGTTTGSVTGGSQSRSIADNAKLVRHLERAPTEVERLALLTDDSDFVFDFTAPVANSTTTGDGGHTVKADRLTFPALVGTGVSMTVGFLGPCGFNTPHTHPRSSEINFVAAGRLIAEMVPENGARVVRNLVASGQMTVFPRGALHTEFNPECEPARFVAGFASEDPGVQQGAQSFFELDDDLIQAAFGSDFSFDGADIDKFRSLIPANVALGVEKCLKKCKINKR